MFTPQTLKIPSSAYTFTLNSLSRLKPLKPGVSFPMIDSFPHGSPLGGFGAGTFSRSPYGDFNIWHLFPGAHIHESLEACGLAVWRKTKNKTAAAPLSLQNKSWPGQKLKASRCRYAALYPRSWYVYPEVQAVIEQFSPILPHNYRETSYPAACFNVQLSNPRKSPQEISVLFSWQNMLGWGRTLGANATEHRFSKNAAVRRWNERRVDNEYKAIVFQSSSAGADTLSGEMCLMTYAPAGALVSFCTQYDTEQPPDIMWEPFAARGVLRDNLGEEYAQPAGALAVKVLLNPGETITIPFVLTWDIPRYLNDRTARYYTKYLNTDGNNAFALAREVLQQQKKYALDIARWQAGFSRKMPRWLAGQLFNELYYLADGGSVWDADSGMYSCLECLDYPFYETLDVRFYGSFPLAKFWPEIEKRILQEFSKTVFAEDTTKITYHAQAAVLQDVAVSGEHNKSFVQKDYRKRKYALPHDLGSPFEEPWAKLNAYTWQNTNRWKDLNSKFVLLLYRAYYYSGKKDHAFLAEIWPGLVKAIEYLDTLDIDQDGLPENEAFPDQTFDNWLMHGTSAYCGILRLAALQAGIQIAEVSAKKEQARQWRLRLKKARDSLNRKLWNGKYFRFDERSEIIMAAQLTGQWYLEQLRLPSVLEDSQIDSALRQIYQRNFQRIARGRHGLVNGRTADGLPVSASQGNDAWVGINYAVACHLLLRGRRRQAEKILKSVTEALRQGGLLFRTPEAWNAQEHYYIASMYQRPGVIWTLADWY
ncbi:MAG: hypothetical protein LBQ83_02010 [Candidatus Margulisbacteria bacterium]|jgi:non-lysosomal glucosylceramidase|nr:hypothetical protein [Candidatus Margulisiibacteriota bacterium]